MSFKGLNLSKPMLDSLKNQGFVNPSDVQLRVIPKALKKESLMVQSATGTGKTLCYLIPIIENIDLKNQNVQAIVVVPTRELAKQVFDSALAFNKLFPELKVRLFKSGEEKENTTRGLSIPPHIIIGTPGRLADVLKDDSLSLKHVKTLVFDEADMLLREGYFTEIDQFAFKIQDPQYLVFSATLEANLAHELDRYVGPNMLIVNEDTMTSKNVKHFLIDIHHVDKYLALEQVINNINPFLLLVFASKKETANEAYAYLKKQKYKVGLLTGDLNARERKNVMKQLKNEDIYILVCSDMAARGLDINDVSDVINLDLPNNLEFYYHRAGRTGRFSKTGNCYTLYNNDSTRGPLALVDDGIQFTYLNLSNGELKEGKPIERSHPTKRKVDQELENKIRKISAKAKGKNKKVKPGYKKKVREEIAKAKQKHRREIIKKDIKRQRIERYRKENMNG